MTPARFEKLKSRLARRQPDLTVLAENVHKSHNIAAILRTADAVGIPRIHAVSETDEFRRHHLITGGSAKWVDVTLHDDIDTACKSLHGEGFRIVGAHPDPDAHDYRETDYTGKVAILMGAELDGMTTRALELADECVSIPMEGMVASLNVSVAAALILYEARRQRASNGMYDECRLPREVYTRTLFEWTYPQVAELCRLRGLPYPPLADDGRLLENPLARA